MKPSTDTAVPADAERATRLDKFRRNYFSTPPNDIDQLAADAMIVVIDQEARAKQAESALAHRDARLAAIVQEMRAYLSDGCLNLRFIHTQDTITKWADQLAALQPEDTNRR